ncbi:heparan-alpha-glucosaminide N-acetyltransferase [Xinfangfangia sp. CPCC 101601]|uniref:Heparan-alpha-glucosaminide N-acetyltransferase n=1 Tax=Pseudogemmobacter lacusdianii TaxID=3069608 RepID=A0ABU0W0Z3_9RHOB|nr:heparan-alpha-glucosaminide N-acetyltransferase [Xinfangfangia sp. CPCC 101601]MDQ2067568.1 heparan-alpha-glucosaminide N-acetyltransferase [Xinfangfangia sp. CPCC 101601]
MQGQRLIGLDLIRSAALLSMVAYHFTYDLDLFGLIPRYTSVTGFFWWHARLTAGSFIFLAGLSLWLAHGAAIRWPAFWKRFAKIAAGAAAVSLATYIAMPQLTVFYGILHSIAVSSLIGLAALRLPALLTALLAIMVFALPYVVQSPLFDHWLIWTGLGSYKPATADFLPLFPWLAPLLAGVAAGKAISHFGLWPWFKAPSTPLTRALAWPGRHTLAIYLLHQPLLIGAFNLYFWALR